MLDEKQRTCHTYNNEIRDEEYLKMHHEEVASQECLRQWYSRHNHEDVPVVGNQVEDEMIGQS